MMMMVVVVVFVSPLCMLLFTNYLGNFTSPPPFAYHKKYGH